MRSINTDIVINMHGKTEVHAHLPEMRVGVDRRYQDTKKMRFVQVSELEPHHAQMDEEREGPQD